MRSMRLFIRDSIPIRPRLSRRVQYAVLSLLMLFGVITPALPAQAVSVGTPVSSAWWNGSYSLTQDFGCTDFQRELNGAPYGCPQKWHSGLDIGAGCGVPIIAGVDGAKIISKGGNAGSTGIGLGADYPTILLPDGNFVVFGHNNQLTAPLNTPLAKGTQITTVGNNGNSTACHIHFEVLPSTTPINPPFTDPTGKHWAYGMDPWTELYPKANPGGWWTSPTPANGNIVFPGQQITLAAHFEDNGNGGLSKTNITLKNAAVGQDWHIINTASTLGNGASSADRSQTYTVPIGTTNFYVSFDVYSNNTRFVKAPNGIRKYCVSPPNNVCDTSDTTGTNPLGMGGATCSTAPTTTATVTGATPGNNGWWRSTASVGLSVNAPCGSAGIQTYYRINGGDRQTYSSPIALNQEGRYDVTYYSIDSYGNIEGVKSKQVNIDWTPPVTAGTATGPRDTNGIFRDNVTVGLNGTDNLSGVDFQKYSLNGGTNWTTVTGATNSFPITGNGISRALYYSTDIAGNVEQPPKDSGPIIINKYTIFANNSGQSLRFLFNGGGTNISGDLFTNGTTKIDWDTGSTYGTTFKTVGTNNTIGMYNTGTTIPTIQTGVQPVPMLAYPLSLYQSLATVVFPSSLYMDSVGTSLKDTIYVNGNVDMYNVGLGGSLSIVATGTINDWTTNSTYSTNDPNNGMLLYAGQNMNLRSTGNRNLGLMYAPNGTIKVDGATGLDLKGSLVADQVEVNSATGFTLNYSPAFASSSYPLPLTAMGLVKPTGTVPPLAGIPSRYAPANNATVNKSGVNMSWSDVSGAAGYQLQIAKSTSFSPVEYDMSTLSSTHRAKLASSATTYYWRVRSVNQAGLGTWSTTGTFRTQ